MTMHLRERISQAVKTLINARLQKFQIDPFCRFAVIDFQNPNLRFLYTLSLPSRT